VEDAEGIRLLGSAVRLDLLDYLESTGPATVSELAGALGRPADTLYYHIRLLRAAGILVRCDGDGKDREGRGMLLDLSSDNAAVRYRQQPEIVEALADMVSTLLRNTGRRFRAAMAGEAGDVSLEGPRRNVWAARVRGRLTEEELREVNEAIERVVAIFHRGRERRGTPVHGRLHEVSMVLVPLPESPVDRRKG
jgi:DNA-binding transcriptional ArsR family regulator